MGQLCPPGSHIYLTQRTSLGNRTGTTPKGPDTAYSPTGV